MNTQKKIKIYNRAIAKYCDNGQQIKKAIEELGKLITAIAKGDRQNIIEEVADVKDMLMQIECIYDIEQEVEAMQKRKTARTIARLGGINVKKKHKVEECKEWKNWIVVDEDGQITGGYFHSPKYAQEYADRLNEEERWTK